MFEGDGKMEEFSVVRTKVGSEKDELTALSARDERTGAGKSGKGETTHRRFSEFRQHF